MSLRAAVLALTLSSGALAETTEAPKVAPPQRPVAAFGFDNPECLQWSDGCVACRRLEDGSPACSTPGIACVPDEPACKTAKD
jgi:hypothetical protein